MPKTTDPAVLLKDLLEQALEIADHLPDHEAAGMIAHVIFRLERNASSGT